MSVSGLCPKCQKIDAFSAVLKVCAGCGTSSDKDPQTLKFCASCAKKKSVCRCCGKKVRRA